MTNSELIRWLLVAMLIVIVVVRRFGLLDRIKEKRLKQDQAAAEEQRKAQRRERQEKLRKRAEQKKRQTAEILQQSLTGMQLKSMAVGSLELWYAEGGSPGDSPSIILLHGFAGAKEDWEAVSQGLLRLGAHVIAPDLPGFGQNDKNPDLSYDVSHQAKSLRALVHRLGVQRAHWVGHSVGATIAAAIAYGVPAEVATLTLIEPFGVRVPAETELDTFLARGLNPLVIAAPTGFDNLLNFLFHRPPPMSETLKAHRAEEAAKHRIFFLKVWQQLRGGDQAHLLDLLLPEIQLRTLVLQGAQSRVVHPTTVQAIQSMMANAKGKVIDESGHMVMVEQAEETVRQLAAWLPLHQV